MKPDREYSLTAGWTFNRSGELWVHQRCFCQINSFHSTQRSDANFWNSGEGMPRKNWKRLLWFATTEGRKRRDNSYMKVTCDHRTDMLHINYSLTNSGCQYMEEVLWNHLRIPPPIYNKSQTWKYELFSGASQTGLPALLFTLQVSFNGLMFLNSNLDASTCKGAFEERFSFKRIQTGL